MPRLDYKTCKSCGGHASEVGPLSWNRLCRRCGHARCMANAEQISQASGPYFEHQQRRTLMVAQRRLLAAAQTRE